MKFILISVFLLTTASIHAGITGPPTGTVSFEFDTSSNAIIGVTFLADDHDSAIDGKTTATAFSLDSVISGLILTVTPSQDDISYTTAGLGIDTGGNLSASGDALTFSFNKAITFDFIDLGTFTGSGAPGDDAVSISYSNSNPTVNLIGGDFDNNSSDTITFSSGNALAANQSFTISYVDGNGFTLEGFNVTIVPEPGTYALLSGICALGFVMLRRRQ